MKKYRIEDFMRGWFIGNFEPSLLKKDFEVGLLSFDKEHIHTPHFHKKNTEFNLVISGKVRINDQIFVEGDIFIIEPYVVSHEVEYLEKTKLLVVRDYSDPIDKFLYKTIE